MEILKHIAVWLAYSLHQRLGAKNHARSVGVELVWVGSGKICPGRPVNLFYSSAAYNTSVFCCSESL